MKKKEFDNWKFAKGQTVTYKNEAYKLIGVNFEGNSVCIKIDGNYTWVSYKKVIITPF